MRVCPPGQGERNDTFWGGLEQEQFGGYDSEEGVCSFVVGLALDLGLRVVLFLIFHSNKLAARITKWESGAKKAKAEKK